MGKDCDAGVKRNHKLRLIWAPDIEKLRALNCFQGQICSCFCFYLYTLDIEISQSFKCHLGPFSFHFISPYQFWVQFSWGSVLLQPLLGWEGKMLLAPGVNVNPWSFAICPGFPQAHFIGCKPIPDCCHLVSTNVLSNLDNVHQITCHSVICNFLVMLQ